MNNKAQIIVNADDFGKCEAVNHAILKAFKINIISSSTLMCNMPGYDEAIQMVHENHLKDRIGIHLNITDGQSLTEQIKKYPKFYSQDKMYKSFKGYILNSEESKVVYQEFQAQLNKIKKGGINPTHIDSHHNMHFYWSIGKIIQVLASNNKISAIRLRSNWGIRSIKSNSYSRLYNYRLKVLGLAKTDYFCKIRSVNSDLLNKNSIIEVNAHPFLSSDNIIINKPTGEILSELIRKYLPIEKIISYPS